ncbi:MAG: hypothetical protein JW870_03530, partial [Candidatus Delongbacteria bacterium]|nr:hypothetical protein [Candidatus Delongbacteria bacterium]
MWSTNYKSIFLVAVLFVVSLLNAQFGGGAGTEGNPYLITSAQDLYSLAGNVNVGTNYSGKYFLQTENIDIGYSP